MARSNEFTYTWLYVGACRAASAARQRAHLARPSAAAPQSMHRPFARRSARRCLWAAAVLSIIPPLFRVKPIQWTQQELNLDPFSPRGRGCSHNRTHTTAASVAATVTGGPYQVGHEQGLPQMNRTRREGLTA